jgi:hypothetical protein
MALAIGAMRAGSGVIRDVSSSLAIRVRADPFADGSGKVKASPSALPLRPRAHQLSTGPAKPLRGRENDCKSGVMTGDRTEAAVQRIEAALARIAAAAERPRSDAPVAAPSVSALVERHESLRETVTQAIGEIDALLSDLAP